MGAGRILSLQGVASGLLVVALISGCAGDGGPPGPAEATRLAFRVQPRQVFANRPFPQIVKVAALDRYGNTATDFRGDITVRLDPSGSLSGTTSVPAVSGVATFADLRIAQVGAGYILTASADGLPSVTTAAFDVVTPGPGRIVFMSDRDGNDEIYSMNVDGSDVVRLTTDPALDVEPAWSPDGTKIAFMSTRAGVAGIFTMNVDGSGLVAVADTSRYPAWSPDGTRLVGNKGVHVCGARGCGFLYRSLFLMNADGSGRVVLTNGITPAWSADGRIAFDLGDIYAMNPDGTGLTKLTNGPGNYFPAWSPDGAKIAFVGPSAGASDVYVMNADGTGVMQLTHDQVNAARPAWSPDGTKIAFASLRDGSWEIYVMNADGSGVTRLTDNGATWPSWSP